MCGIAGLFSFANGELNSYEARTEGLQAQLRNLGHRGPDNSGIFIDGPIALGHTRLSIIDIAHGAQPMSSASNSTHIVFNGEIFNYLELKQKLKAAGRIFQTESDTEVILHMYEVYGEDFVHQLNGQFAIALWDKRKQQLLLIRDRVGICPLFYYCDKEQLIFASEIKAIAPVLKQSLSLSPKALDQIFSLWVPLAHNTAFNDIYQVCPGEMLTITKAGITRKTYWDFQFPENWEGFDHRPAAVLAEELQQHLSDATKLRLRADVPVGSYLSGGLDSSIIAALINRQQDVSLRTFSISFTDKSHDESSYQQLLAQQLNIDHSSILVRPEDIEKNLVNALWHAEAPILRTAPIPMGLLSQHVQQQNFKVVLTGEGADEVLGGYDLFKEAKVRQFWARQPDSQWRPLLIKKLYPYLELPNHKALNYLQQFFGIGLKEPDVWWHSHLPRWQTTAKAKLFFSDALKAEMAGDIFADLAESLPSTMANWHWFNRAQYIESKTLMANYLLSSQGDRMLTQHSIEGRFPFLDHRVIEFANRLPPTLKMKALNEKYLLKQAMAQHIPAAIIDRHKKPYRSPDILALTTPQVPAWVKELLSENSLKDSGYFDSKKVSMLLKKAESGRLHANSESQALVGILSTQIIHQLFIKSTPRESLSL